MSTTVDTAFVRHYQTDVHASYQRMGSKLRNTVRSKNKIVGSSTVFQTVGKGTASTKARHGKVPVMNAEHGTVECQLYDYYAGDWIDALDDLKNTGNERQITDGAPGAGFFRVASRSPGVVEVAETGQREDAVALSEIAARPDAPFSDIRPMGDPGH